MPAAPEAQEQQEMRRRDVDGRGGAFFGTERHIQALSLRSYPTAWPRKAQFHENFEVRHQKPYS